jgi:predicted ATP-grasp superfamily ATP-dependent carboligase
VQHTIQAPSEWERELTQDELAEMSNLLVRHEQLLDQVERIKDQLNRIYQRGAQRVRRRKSREAFEAQIAML